MQLDPVNNEDHTQHVVQWAWPRRGPAHQQRAMEARLLRMRSPCLEFTDTSWECGRETPAHPATSSIYLRPLVFQGT